MAIRTINYILSADGISPSAEQAAGLRGEHSATELKFTLSMPLYSAVMEEKGEGDRIVYRFDCYDGLGNSFISDTADLEDDAVGFTLGENLTRAGGRLRVYLVISRIGASEQAETELFSFPARLYFENVPLGGTDCGEPRASLSALGEISKTAAGQAIESAASALAAKQAAEAAQEKTELARRALEQGSEFVFDGGNAAGAAGVEFVVDPELSGVSENAVSNRAVTAGINGIETEIGELKGTAAGLAGRIDAQESGLSQLEGTVSELESDLSARTGVYIVESGTEGIWSWRKWSDGTAECWGKSTQSVDIKTLEREIYHSDKQTLNLPSGLFINSGTVTASIGSNYGQIGCSLYGAGAWQDNIQYYLTANSVLTAVQATRHFHVIGRWKTA